MNILFISPNSPLESVGGVERYITNLSSYSENQLNHKTVIILPTYKADSVKKVGNLVTYYESNLASLKNMSGRDISERARQFSEKVELILATHKINVICAENFHVGLPAAYSLQLNMIAKLHKIPLVLRLHSFATTDLQVELVNQLMWNKISSVSKSVTGDCFQKGANIDILSTDYLGVNIDEFNNRSSSKTGLKETLNLPSDSKVILLASRIIHGRKNILKEKGIINLIQAFSKLSPRFPSLHLLLAIGKPPASLDEEFTQAYNMLTGYIKLNNIESKTIVKTFGLNEMPSVYAGADIFTLPSENETFGQVFIEAMASGTPVVGTNVGGIPEIISDSFNGFLVQPNDSSVLAQRIEVLLSDQELRNKFVDAGIKTVEDRFTTKKQFVSFIKTLEDAIADTPRASS